MMIVERVRAVIAATVFADGEIYLYGFNRCAMQENRVNLAEETAFLIWTNFTYFQMISHRQPFFNDYPKSMKERILQSALVPFDSPRIRPCFKRKFYNIKYCRHRIKIYTDQITQLLLFLAIVKKETQQKNKQENSFAKPNSEFLGFYLLHESFLFIMSELNLCMKFFYSDCSSIASARPPTRKKANKKEENKKRRRRRRDIVKQQKYTRRHRLFLIALA